MTNRSGDPNKIAKVVVPLAIAAWLGGILIARPGVPHWVGVVLGVLFACAVIGALVYLFMQMGWAELAKRHPMRQAYRGAWSACPTMYVWHDSPPLRLVSIMRVGATEDFLYIGSIFSELPILSALFPTVQIPWSAIKTAALSQESGMVQSPSKPGTLLQLTYDPGFRGEIVELGVGDPPVFVQFRSDVLPDESKAKLPI